MSNRKNVYKHDKRFSKHMYSILKNKHFNVYIKKSKHFKSKLCYKDFKRKP